MHGAAADDPVVWYEGSGLGTRRHLRTDHQGSVIAITDGSGSSFAINSYDEYGAGGSGNVGTFRYTGQAYLPQVGLHYYKARMYSAVWGRFLQTDPVGYEGGPNLYAYVGNDPLNQTDPLGLDACPRGDRNCVEDPRTERPDQAPPSGQPITPAQRDLDEVVVKAKREGKIGNIEIDFTLPYPSEQYGAVEGTTVTPVQGKKERKYSCSDGSSGASNVLSPSDFADADAAVHTHPDWADPSPGIDDGAIPGSLGIANYGISPEGAWVVERTPSGYRARLITGRWGASRANVQSAVRGYNTGGGKGTSKKKCTYQ